MPAVCRFASNRRVLPIAGINNRKKAVSITAIVSALTADARRNWPTPRR